MRTFLFSFVLAASLSAQLLSPGIFTSTVSTTAGEKLEITVTDPFAFEYIPFVQVLMYQNPITPLSVVNSCNIYVDTGLFAPKQVWLTKPNQTGWYAPAALGSDVTLDNGTCAIDVKATSYEKISTTAGKLTLALSYPGTAPPIAYFLGSRYSDFKLSFFRFRPQCPPHAEPGQIPQQGCPQ